MSILDGVTLYVQASTPPPAVVAPSIWPAPSNIAFGTATLVVDGSDFKFQYAGGEPPSQLQVAFSRISARIFDRRTPAPPDAVTICGSVVVTVSSPSTPLQLGVNESYTLTVPDDGSPIRLAAETVFGALNGLETLSQLIRFSPAAHAYLVQQAPMAISDTPQFPWRGLLVDSSRHYESVASLKQYVDSLTTAKVNTVHWHITDEQAVPFQSTTHPNLWEGSYSASERYTQADIQDVVTYAAERGVRVVPEVDTPGHEASWCIGYPGICPDAVTCPMPLRPDTNATFELILGIFQEFSGNGTGASPLGPLFTDHFLHLGGDEVSTTCWELSPEVSAWLKAEGLSADGGYEYFVKRVHGLAASVGKRAMVWEEVWNHFGTQLPADTVIEAWLSAETAPNVTAHGYAAVWAVDGRWYLDKLDDTWAAMYAQDPLQNISDPAQQKLLLGGEGCMWGETVDRSDWMATVWPRMGAIAERLWTYNQATRDWPDGSASGTPGPLAMADAYRRLRQFRCLQNQWGIGAAPVDNLEARSAPSGPASCFAQ